MDKLLLLYLWLINSLLHLLNFIFLLLLFFFWHLFTLNFKNQLIYFNVINFLFIILIKNSYNFIFFPIKINSVFLYLKLYFIFQFPIKTVTKTLNYILLASTDEKDEIVTILNENNEEEIRHWSRSIKLLISHKYNNNNLSILILAIFPYQKSKTLLLNSRLICKA